MKQTLLAIIATLFAFTVNAQAPLCSWLDGTSSISTNNLQLLYGNGGMKTDAQGNVYFIGEFSGGNFTVGSFTDTNSTANTYFYFGRINPSGSVAWLKEITNTGTAFVRTIAVNDRGNFVIAGDFTGDIAFDPTHQLVNNSFLRYYMASFDSTGLIRWCGYPDGLTNSISDIFGLYMDNNDNTYATGYFGDTLQYDTTVVTPWVGVFTAKFSYNGSRLWFSTADGANKYSYPAGESIVASGNDVYVAGYVNDTLTFAKNNTKIISKGLQNIFMSKYDATNGHLEWAKYMGGSVGNDFVFGIGVDGKSQPCFSGELGDGTGFFGSDSAHGQSSYTSGYLVKCDSSGNPLWVDYATNVPGGFCQFNDVACDSAGNIFVAGTTETTDMLVGSGASTYTTVTNQGFDDGFALAFNTNGQLQWTKSFETNSYETTDQIALKNNILTVAGSYYATLNVDGFNLSNSNGSSSEIFFAQMPLSTTGIEQLQVNNNQLALYPNPSTGAVTITSSKNIDELKVSNLLGQLVYNAQPRQSQYSFELKNEGVYFVTATCGGDVVTKEVVVGK